MMRIKFKVKHLVYIVLVLIGLSLTGFFVIIPGFQYYSAQKAINISADDAEEKFKRAMDNPYLLAIQKRKLIENYLIDSLALTQYDVMVGPSLIEWHDPNRQRVLKRAEIEQYLIDYIKDASIDGYYENAVKQLVSFYNPETEADKIDNTFEDAINRSEKAKDDWHVDELKLAYAQSKISRQDYREAEKILEKLSDQDLYFDFAARVALEKIKILQYQDDLKNAEALLEQTIEDYQESAREEREASGEIVGVGETYQVLQEMEENLEQSTSLTSVNGQIKKNNGQHLQSVGVFLRSKEDVNHGISSSGEYEFYQTVTDNQGRYEIDNVPQGSYQITLGLSYDQIDGWMWPSEQDDWIVLKDEGYEENIEFSPLINIKNPGNQEDIKSDSVTFAWDEVENAAYYRLDFGIRTEEVSMTTSFPEKFSNHRAEISVERLYLHEMARLFEDDDLTEIDGAAILGFMNPDNQMTWSVKAYDADDQLLTSSQGYRLAKDAIGKIPIFHMKTRQLNKADQALLEGNVEEALDLYKANYEADPEDLTSLIMITRLINIEDDKAWQAYMEELVDQTNSSYIKELLETD